MVKFTHGSKMKLFKSKKNIKVVILALVIGLSFTIYIFGDELRQVSRLGYAGLFIATFFSSASILLPLPGALLVIASSTALNPLLVALVSAVGESLGEMVGYAAGRAGKHLIVEEDRRYKQVQGLMQRYGVLPVIGFAAIPNPIFDIVGLVAGVLHFRPLTFFLSVLLGKLLKNLGLVQLGNLI